MGLFLYLVKKQQLHKWEILCFQVISFLVMLVVCLELRVLIVNIWQTTIFLLLGQKMDCKMEKEKRNRLVKEPRKGSNQSWASFGLRIHEVLIKSGANVDS